MDHFLPFHPPPPSHQKPKNSKFFKKWKKCLKTSSFSICVPKIMISWCMAPEIWCTTEGQTDRWTDGWKKWWVPHLKIFSLRAVKFWSLLFIRIILYFFIFNEFFLCRFGILWHRGLAQTMFINSNFPCVLMIRYLSSEIRNSITYI